MAGTKDILRERLEALSPGIPDHLVGAGRAAAGEEHPHQHAPAGFRALKKNLGV
jgi:hypothetical protein